MKKEQSTKEKVLHFLEAKNKTFVSGEQMAGELFLTRASVWKAIKSLREAGYEIEAISNKGYRLNLDKDVLSKAGIDEELKILGTDIETFVFDKVDSTNEYARKLAIAGTDQALVVSDYQSAGRGRRGRTFFSPKGSGLYLSFLLKPDVDVSQATKITSMAAVAVSRAISKVCKIETGIKWVNDIFYNDKKIAGILTEGFTSIEDNSLMYVIVGIGINMYMPKEGFPEEIKKTAGVLFEEGQIDSNVRNRLTAYIAREFISLINDYENTDYVNEYREKSILIGHYVKMMNSDKDKSKGYSKVLGIDDDCRLIVENETKEVEYLSNGEVSVIKY